MTPVSLDVASESRRPTHARPSAAGRWFYVGVAAVACAVCVAGFAPSLLDGSRRNGPMTPLVMVHAAFAAAWVGLYVVQATLVATGRVGAHRALGTGSAIVAAGVVVTAWQASVAMARRGAALKLPACAIISEAHSQSVDFKRRDVRVVEGARLESNSGELHRVIRKHLFTQSIQRLPAAECLLM